MTRRNSLGISVLFAAFPLAVATFTVTNTNDSGAGSLRQAILYANSLGSKLARSVAGP